MTKRTKNASQREWPTCSLQCAAQIRPVEVALYWLKLITDQLKVNFFGGISCGSPIEVCRRKSKISGFQAVSDLKTHGSFF